MSTTHRANATGVSNQGKTGRKTRAGNDLDAFPFDKLSVDGAALAKMIISPLPIPNLRARDPLDNRDNTNPTVSSSEEDFTPKKEKKSVEQIAAEMIGSEKRPIELPSDELSSDEQESPDPDAKHINRIFRASASTFQGSKVQSSDSDSYYDVKDSPRADYYSDVLSEGGWESGMSFTLEEDTPKTPDRYTTVKRSPVKKNDWKTRQASRDPDGVDFNNDNWSYTGEDILPTPDVDLTMVDDVIDSERMQSSSRKALYMASVANSSSSDDSSDDGDLTFDDIEMPPPSFSAEKEVLRSSPFPSKRLLVCLVFVIALAAIGLVAGLTFFFWERSPIDPICPPDDFCCMNPSACAEFVDENSLNSIPPPTDEELLNLFESVAGEAVRSEFTSAGMAAKWMLNEDPGKLGTYRSDDGWIQRYLLVYTYYATTLNRSTSWKSCNPLTEQEKKLNDSDTCMFTQPTELPGGNVVYDLVPSYRWLSGADECQWGGVACGATVVEEIDIGTTDSGSSVPIKSTFRRLAVTSIVLAGQELKGSLVTELTKLPMLQVLDLSHNGLQGSISANYGSLHTLRLQYNAIQGKIPRDLFFEQSLMKELNVGANMMTGTIPAEIGLSSTLTDIYLFGNQFSGSIPHLGNMPLVKFHGQGNAFTGVLPFDYDFGGAWVDSLREWWVYDNKLTGSISDNLGFISNLEDIRINKNHLTGSIPESISELQQLFRFDVQSNKLTGSIPDSIGELPQLRDVFLQYNKFDGEVPSSLCLLESMELLEADCLAFVGAPPTECYCCTTCCNPGLGGCKVY